MAYSGAFKAWLKSVSIERNYDTGAREARFSAILLPEPKLKHFQYQDPVLLSARDDAGKSYAGEPGGGRNYWQRSYRPYISFDSEHESVKITGVPEGARRVTELSFEVPVRLITGIEECRFPKAISAAKPDTRKAGRNSVTLVSLSVADGKGTAKVRIEGEAGGESDSYQFRIERDGEKIGGASSISTSEDEGCCEIELRLRVAGGDDFDLVVTCPSETVETKLKFEFKDLSLP